jgi:hypothetical protein
MGFREIWGEFQDIIETNSGQHRRKEEDERKPDWQHDWSIYPASKRV